MNGDIMAIVFAAISFVLLIVTFIVAKIKKISKKKIFKGGLCLLLVAVLLSGFTFGMSASATYKDAEYNYNFYTERAKNQRKAAEAKRPGSVVKNVLEKQAQAADEKAIEYKNTYNTYSAIITGGKVATVAIWFVVGASMFLLCKKKGDKNDESNKDDESDSKESDVDEETNDDIDDESDEESDEESEE